MVEKIKKRCPFKPRRTFWQVLSDEEIRRNKKRSDRAITHSKKKAELYAAFVIALD